MPTAPRGQARRTRRGARARDALAALALRAAPLVALAAVALGACAGCSRTDRGATLTVLAATSLVDAFAELETAFEAAHPGVSVVLSTGGTQALRLQVEQGSHADVFASADPAHMAALVDAGLVAAPTPFAWNSLVVVVPPDNPADVRSFDELASVDRLVLGNEQVPVGRYARQAIAEQGRRRGDDFEARVLARVVSLEPNSRLVLGKVEMGEADAAIVYRTDAAAGRNLGVIELDAGVSPRAEYAIARVTGSGAPELADAWIAFVAGPAGAAVLAAHGFEVR